MHPPARAKRKPWQERFPTNYQPYRAPSPPPSARLDLLSELGDSDGAVLGIPLTPTPSTIVPLSPSPSEMTLPISGQSHPQQQQHLPPKPSPNGWIASAPSSQPQPQPPGFFAPSRPPPPPSYWNKPPATGPGVGPFRSPYANNPMPLHDDMNAQWYTVPAPTTNFRFMTGHGRPELTKSPDKAVPIKLPPEQTQTKGLGLTMGGVAQAANETPATTTTTAGDTTGSSITLPSSPSTPSPHLAPSSSQQQPEAPTPQIAKPSVDDPLDDFPGYEPLKPTALSSSGKSSDPEPVTEEEEVDGKPWYLKPIPNGLNVSMAPPLMTSTPVKTRMGTLALKGPLDLFKRGPVTAWLDVKNELEDFIQQLVADNEHYSSANQQLVEDGQNWKSACLLAQQQRDVLQRQHLAAANPTSRPLAIAPAPLIADDGLARPLSPTRLTNPSFFDTVVLDEPNVGRPLIQLTAKEVEANERRLVELQRLEVEMEEKEAEVRELKRELAEAQEGLQRQEDGPTLAPTTYAAIILHADITMFAYSSIREGRSGGVETAIDISASIYELCGRVFPDGQCPDCFNLMIFLDKTAIASKLVESGVISSTDVFHAFCDGIAETHGLFTTIDVNGEEDTAAKVREHFKFHINIEACTLLYFATPQILDHVTLFQLYREEEKLDKVYTADVPQLRDQEASFPIYATQLHPINLLFPIQTLPAKAQPAARPAEDKIEFGQPKPGHRVAFENPFDEGNAQESSSNASYTVELPVREEPVRAPRSQDTPGSREQGPSTANNGPKKQKYVPPNKRKKQQALERESWREPANTKGPVQVQPPAKPKSKQYLLTEKVAKAMAKAPVTRPSYQTPAQADPWIVVSAVDSGEAAQPTQPAQSAQPAQAIRPLQIPQPTPPTQFVQPIQPVRPAQSIRPAWPFSGVSLAPGLPNAAAAEQPSMQVMQQVMPNVADVGGVSVASQAAQWQRQGLPTQPQAPQVSQVLPADQQRSSAPAFVDASNPQYGSGYNSIVQQLPMSVQQKPVHQPPPQQQQPQHQPSVQQPREQPPPSQQQPPPHQSQQSPISWQQPQQQPPVQQQQQPPPQQSQQSPTSWHQSQQHAPSTLQHRWPELAQHQHQELPYNAPMQNQRPAQSATLGNVFSHAAHLENETIHPGQYQGTMTIEETQQLIASMFRPLVHPQWNSSTQIAHLTQPAPPIYQSDYQPVLAPAIQPAQAFQQLPTFQQPQQPNQQLTWGQQPPQQPPQQSPHQPLQQSQRSYAQQQPFQQPQPQQPHPAAFAQQPAQTQPLHVQNPQILPAQYVTPGQWPTPQHGQQQHLHAHSVQPQPQQLPVEHPRAPLQQQRTAAVPQVHPSRLHMVSGATHQSPMNLSQGMQGGRGDSHAEFVQSSMSVQLLPMQSTAFYATPSLQAVVVEIDDDEENQDKAFEVAFRPGESVCGSEHSSPDLPARKVAGPLKVFRRLALRAPVSAPPAARQPPMADMKEFKNAVGNKELIIKGQAGDEVRRYETLPPKLYPGNGSAPNGMHYKRDQVGSKSSYYQQHAEFNVVRLTSSAEAYDYVRNLVPRPCHKYYLYGECRTPSCHFGHQFELSELAYAALAKLAKEMLCPDFDHGKCNRLESECLYGHRCPRGNKCQHGDDCWFANVPDGHPKTFKKSSY